MKPIYLQENFHYTKKMLFNIFARGETLSEDSIKETLNILNKLKARNIIKLTKYDKDQESLTSDFDTQNEYDASLIKNDKKVYSIMFVYVGVIYVCGQIIFVCPKYLNHDYITNSENNQELTDTFDPLLGKDSKYTEKELFSKMKTVHKVILKYLKESDNNVDIDISQQDNNEQTRLFSLLYFLNDYFENGLYYKSIEQRTINGSGDIDWNRTVNNTYPLLSNGRPYYTDVYTSRRIEDKDDFIRRLHISIITACTLELQNCNLLDFFDLTGEDLSEQVTIDISDEDSKEYILNKIQMEMKVQYNTRNQNLLNAMYSYINESYYKTSENDDLLYSGTKSFNLIWEKICGEILDNKLESPVSSLPYNKEKCNDEFTATTKLKDIIPKTNWEFNFNNKKQTSHGQGKLNPDILSTPNNKTFIIFDAKYYIPYYIPNTNKKSGTVNDVPGVEDVNKQYLYQLVFKRFIKNFDIENVANCFIMPTEDDDVRGKSDFKGIVTTTLFNNYIDGLVPIQIRFLPADEVYKTYLTGQKYTFEDFKKLKLFDED